MRLNVDVIVANGTAVSTVKQATSVIPIVFPIAVDPVGGGFVVSLARPGGNVTGLSLQQSDAESKRLELLREVVPSLHRLAIMTNVGAPQAVLEMGEVQAAARKLGIEVAPLEIRRAEDIAPAFAAIKAQTDAIYLVQEALVNSNRTGIITLVLSARLPTVNANRICEAHFGTIFRYNGKALVVTAWEGVPPEYLALLQSGPLPVDERTATGRAAKSKQAVHIADLSAELPRTKGDQLRARLVELGGVRTILAVPMLKERQLVGAISIYRKEVRPFTDKQIALLKRLEANGKHLLGLINDAPRRRGQAATAAR